MSIQLPKEIQSYLINLISNGKEIQLSIKDMNFLNSEFLIDNTGNLTDLGVEYAISFLSLKNQCHHLNIKFNQLNELFEISPEKHALHYFLKKRYNGIFAEGYFLHTVIKALLLKTLIELNPFNSRIDAIRRYLPAQLQILKKQKDRLLHSISIDSYLDNFSEIIHDPFIKETSKGLCDNVNMALICAENFLKIIPLTSIRLILNELINDQSLCFGWPDLTVIKNNTLTLIEVKTTDKLSLTQIHVIKKFNSALNLNLSILQLKSL